MHAGGHHHHHHHSHDHSHHHAHGNIVLAFWLNTLFAVVELVGGLYTNSVAILSDALHDLGDSLSLGTAWYFERKSHQKRDETYTYGYKRFSIIGAFVNSMVLVTGSIFIIKESLERVFDPQQPDTTGMLVFAGLGIVVNGAAMLRLRKGHTLNEKVISLHFIEDVLGWVAVLIGSIVMKYTDAPFIDPLLSMGIAAFILFNVYRNMRSAFQIILQGVPLNVSEEMLKSVFKEFGEVMDTHDLHIWTLDGSYNILTTHVVLKEDLATPEAEQLKSRMKSRLREINVQHATIEFESRNVVCQKHDHEF